MFRSCSLCRYSVGPGRIMATPTQLEELTSWLANHSQAGTFRKPRFWLLFSAASFLLSAAALLAVFLPQPFGIPTAAADYLRVTVFFQFSVSQLGALVPESPNRNSWSSLDAKSLIGRLVKVEKKFAMQWKIGD